tara:strand:+ start:1244 stop:1447 length:204 start_codon:yes stop_codon:yes gene_type:complete
MIVLVFVLCGLSIGLAIVNLISMRKNNKKIKLYLQDREKKLKDDFNKVRKEFNFDFTYEEWKKKIGC